MTSTNGTVLISGASVAGPTLAYWLRRYGYRPTVVERRPARRRGLGGHAIDLFGPAVDVVDRMGLLPAVRAAFAGTELLSFERPGRSAIDVEIMCGELASIL
jgi:2-polyprenyl-6-methoxyphenol hydroxylase-like FAD-dependent oxidoreductase